MPYFELICNLGDQKVEMEGERENLKSEVLACQAEIGHVEQDIEVIHFDCIWQREHDTIRGHRE